MFRGMNNESGQSKAFRTVSTYARLFGLAIGALLVSRAAVGQSQRPARPAHSQSQVREENRKSFTRFLEMQKKAALAPGQSLGSRRVAAAAAVKSAPGKDAKRDRLLKYQEERAPSRTRGTSSRIIRSSRKCRSVTIGNSPRLSSGTRQRSVSPRSTILRFRRAAAWILIHSSRWGRPGQPGRWRSSTSPCSKR